MNTTIYISYFSYCPIYLSERAVGGRIGFDLRLWMGESITVEEAGQVAEGLLQEEAHMVAGTLGRTSSHDTNQGSERTARTRGR